MTEDENIQKEQLNVNEQEDVSIEKNDEAAVDQIDEKAAFEKKIEQLENENAELKDQLLRRAADFDNYRKRTIKEKAEAVEYANSNLLSDLLESLDNFDRTVEAANTATDAKAVADGVKMINSSLVSLLESKYNLVAFGKPGDLFNPDEHEALRSEDGSVKEPEIKEVYLKGYKLKDRIIRHAKVMVQMPDGSTN